MAFDLNREKMLIYTALIWATRTANLRDAFYNDDPGDLVYAFGAEGTVPPQPINDTPERNALFQMLQSLTNDLGDRATTPIRTWQDFCKLALEADRVLRS